MSAIIEVPIDLVDSIQARTCFLLEKTRYDMQGSYVYFIEAVGLGRVKIGYTTGTPNHRLYALQIASPVKLRIAALQDGDMAVERSLHRQFKAERLHGEWFRLGGKVSTYINVLNGEGESDDSE